MVGRTVAEKVSQSGERRSSLQFGRRGVAVLELEESEVFDDARAAWIGALAHDGNGGRGQAVGEAGGFGFEGAAKEVWAAGVVAQGREAAVG
jgi:hypothetical protein